MGSCILARRASCLSGGANRPAKNCYRSIICFPPCSILQRCRRPNDGVSTANPCYTGKEGETLPFFLFPGPRIYIPSRQREITRKLYDVSNVRSFLSGTAAIASRTSFAKLAAKTCETRVRCPSPLPTPLAVVIYLRFVCPPAAEGIRVQISSK